MWPASPSTPPTDDLNKTASLGFSPLCGGLTQKQAVRVSTDVAASVSQSLGLTASVKHSVELKRLTDNLAADRHTPPCIQELFNFHHSLISSQETKKPL